MSGSLQQLFAILTLLLASLSSQAAWAGDALERVIDFGELRVGMSGNQPPMTMISKDGESAKSRPSIIKSFPGEGCGTQVGTPATEWLSTQLIWRR